MKPSDIEREVELTMSSLDRLRKATAPIDFADVIASKMIFSEEVKWIKRAKLALAAMIAMAIINGTLIFKNQIDQRDIMLDSIAQQYHLIGDL